MTERVISVHGQRRLNRRRRRVLVVTTCSPSTDARCPAGEVVGHPPWGPSSAGGRWGHVRQLDRVSRELLARAWAAGAGPGDAPFTIGPGIPRSRRGGDGLASSSRASPPSTVGDEAVHSCRRRPPAAGHRCRNRRRAAVTRLREGGHEPHRVRRPGSLLETVSDRCATPGPHRTAHVHPVGRHAES